MQSKGFMMLLLPHYAYKFLGEHVIDFPIIVEL
jgi:hypothetical protein